MKHQKIVPAIVLYIVFLLIGHHGPLSLTHAHDDQPHAHKKHTLKLFKKDDDVDGSLALREYALLNV